jgi:vancomycin permeability regulator SanA
MKVYLLARNASTMVCEKVHEKVHGKKVWLVAGLCLKNNLPIEEYNVRLDRVTQLMIDGTEPEKILILGGITGYNRISEAQAGADYLQQQGVPESLIILEDQSRHTLENMQHARSLLVSQVGSENNALIISSRYHLYRILTLAKGLGMQLMPVAAEKQFRLDSGTCLLIIKEAYFLHWYWSGKIWVYITANRHSRNRIT